MGIEVLFKDGEAYVSKDKENIGRVSIRGGLPYFHPRHSIQHSINTNSGQEGDNTPTEDGEDTDPGKETQDTGTRGKHHWPNPYTTIVHTCCIENWAMPAFP